MQITFLTTTASILSIIIIIALVVIYAIMSIKDSSVLYLSAHVVYRILEIFFCSCVLSIFHLKLAKKKENYVLIPRNVEEESTTEDMYI